MRLIDADAMHTFVEEKVAEGKDGWANGVPYEWAYALTAVDMQPTIDAEPVRHGEWAHLGGDEWCCTSCGNVIYTEGSWEKPTKKYCHECGAKMDAEEET